jgi:peptide/nickel transport system substrate-binding protein
MSILSKSALGGAACRRSRRAGQSPNVRTVTIVAILMAVATSVVSVSGADARSFKEGGTFRVGIPAEAFDTIDWALTQVPGPITVLHPTCASLMAFPDKPFPAARRPVPEIAADYPKISNGGKTYVFTIRKGVRLSTGATVTARDVAHTLNRLLDPSMKAFSAGIFQNVVGAKAVLAGRAREAAGVVPRGNTLTIKLTKALGDFQARAALLCVVPQSIPPDPEGAKPPIPAAGPYYVSQYVPGERVVLERNSFYRGNRPHHIDRFVVDLAADSATLLDRVDRSELDYAWVPTADYAARADEFRRKYGLNRSRFFSTSADFIRLFVLNTAHGIFKDNPELRKAVNFAIDRRALLRERGPLAGYVTDQYLPASIPGFRNARIYPLKAPDLARARTLAAGHRRSGRAVLYVPATPLGVAQGQIVKQSLSQIGIAVEMKQFPVPVLFEKLATRGKPFDIGWIGWLANVPDPDLLNDLFDGRNIGNPSSGNYSYFDSPRYNSLLGRASRLTGQARYREYGHVDVQLARDAAPAIAYAYDSALTLVSARTGCVVVNPYLDLTAVCLK